MTNEQIYEILASKPHNARYLKRYLNFVLACKSQRKNGYVEEHHICPKAKDLFPEYTDLKVFKWNSVALSARQHIIAHIMLWKAYGDTQIAPVHYMLSVQNQATGYNHRKIPTSISVRYAAQARERYYAERKGKAPFRDANGKNYFINTTDPLIKELGLVGYLQGFKMKEESKERMRRSKDHSRRATLWNGAVKKVVISTSEEYTKMLAEGWTKRRQPDSYAEGIARRIAATSEALTGTITYYRADGSYYGRLAHDHPDITKYDLRHIRSENQKRQASEQALLNSQNRDVQDKKSKVMSAKKWYYDPVTMEKGRFEVAPEGWVPGRAGTTNNGGTVTWNDGAKNYMLKAGEVPEPHWVKGMKPRHKKV